MIGLEVTSQTDKKFEQVDGHSSDYMIVVYGVPQGSVLGPTLFILYIDDQCNVSNLGKYVLFADDTNIFKSGLNVFNLCKKISIELGKIIIWFNVDKLSLNFAKTDFMVFEYNKNVCQKVMIHEKDIESVAFTNCLCVLIDKKLN